MQSYKKLLLTLAVVVLAALQLWTGNTPSERSGGSGVSGQPQQAQPSAQQRELEKTLARIRAGGPFPYTRDGIVFENRERRLPNRPRGYYREYTVDTPGLTHRGPRRVVTGGNPPEVYYYTEDHYGSFIRIEGR